MHWMICKIGMDNREYMIKQEYEKKLADMKELLECEHRIKLTEKDEEITSRFASAKARIETFRTFMPDQTIQDNSIAYLPTLIDLFMIGRCDTETHEWSEHETNKIFDLCSPNPKINQFFHSVSLSSQ